MIPIVVGLGFGDEGKGTITDFLARKNNAKYVVRFSGGSQTAHNVVLPNGTHHTFAQFGSGTFAGAGTIITKHMLVNPFNMFSEHVSLANKAGWLPFEDTFIDGKSLLITPVHIQANRQREINRGTARHGSCGEGIGETRMIDLRTPIEALRMEDMASEHRLREKLVILIEHYTQEIPYYDFNKSKLDDLVQSYKDIYKDIFQHVIISEASILSLIDKHQDEIVFEGSQGVLLDEVHGFHPNTTWTSTTSNKALEVLEQIGLSKEDSHVHGILRTYLTRHGDGAFPAELSMDEWSRFPEEHNMTGKWQGAFRIGMFDVPLMKYALEADGQVDSIALTHCDVPIAGVVTEYDSGFPKPQKLNSDMFDSEYRTMIGETARNIKDFTVEKLSTQELIGIIEEVKPVGIISSGATFEDKMEL